MEAPIVPESVLLGFSEEIRMFAAGFRNEYNVDVDNPLYGTAFSFFTLFARHPNISQFLNTNVDERSLFYNKYFWFKRFTHLHGQQHGYDAGLEQQSFKMLEEACFDLDWEIIDFLDKRSGE